MQDMSVQGVTAVQQQSRAAEQQPSEGETKPTPPTEEAEEEKTLVEMIQEAQEKAKNQRETLKLSKGNTRYGDAPLEAYARLARAKTSAEVNIASGFARRRIAQFKTALRMDSENAARIKSAISQLQKAVSRGEKKRELVRERLEERRKEKSEAAEERMKQEIRRRRAQRMIREAGYLREAKVADRLSTQLTATQVELRQQAQDLAGENAVSLECAVQQYTETAAAPMAAVGPAISVQG